VEYLQNVSIKIHNMHKMLYLVNVFVIYWNIEHRYGSTLEFLQRWLVLGFLVIFIEYVVRQEVTLYS
jgi:hypothetical protein